MYSLHHGQSGGGAWRGATWHDERSAAVWLVASGPHRSGDRSDFYAKAQRLHESGKLLPTAADYERLLVARNAAVVPALVREVRALADEAREVSQRTCVARVAGKVTLHLHVRTQPARSGAPTEEKVWLAIDTRGLMPGWLEIIRAVAIADAEPGAWRYVTDFPERPENHFELRFYLERELQDAAPTGDAVMPPGPRRADL